MTGRNVGMYGRVPLRIMERKCSMAIMQTAEIDAVQIRYPHMERKCSKATMQTGDRGKEHTKMDNAGNGFAGNTRSGSSTNYAEMHKLGNMPVDVSGLTRFGNVSEDYWKMLGLLAREFPNRRAAFAEIINLQAIMNLPKGTEHFLSDPHGEYEAFAHIINNCSGVIREKVEAVFGETMTRQEQDAFCTLIYYPEKELERMKKQGQLHRGVYKQLLERLIELTRFVSSKYTRNKVRRAMPEEFAFIIDELMHAQKDEDDNRTLYHSKILDSILDTESADDFITALCELTKRLTVDRLHIIGDIFDRGEHADKIMDLLRNYKNELDIQWGNHDVLWMGAAAGNMCSILNCINNNVKYGNYEVLENGYGISMRSLVLFAEKTYLVDDGMDPLKKAISTLMFKLEGQMVHRHPEYQMDDRCLFEKINWEEGTVEIEGVVYPLKTKDFPTVDPADPLRLTPEEEEVMQELQHAFMNSVRLRHHIDFLYSRGSMYLVCNENLLFHGCIPLDGDGNFEQVRIWGEPVHGKALLDQLDTAARRAWSRKDPDSVDLMWYLWGGYYSPLFGKIIKTFERTYITDESTWNEPKNPYYRFNPERRTAKMILHEFGLFSDRSHIINGHTPVKKGESPIRADGCLYVIDGGFCRAYQKTTGIAGYTLIFNSHGLKLKTHQPFHSLQKAIEENIDIHSDTEVVEIEEHRVMIADTDDGKRTRERIKDLQALLDAYRSGILRES